jgi:hypothetical protein
MNLKEKMCFKMKKKGIGLWAFIIIGLLAFNILNGPATMIGDKIKEATIVTPQQIKADQIVILKEIQKISRLETATNSYKEIFQSNRDDVRLFGWFGEWLTLVANGKVVAGIDLSKIKESDITIVGDTINIALPKSEIFYSILDEDNTYIQSHTSAVFCKRSLDMETKVRQEAVSFFKERAIADNILEDAYTNATDSIRALVISLESQGPATAKPRNITFEQKAD